MDTDRWQLLWQRFDQALELPPVQRQRWLADQCGEDQPMLEELQALIAAQSQRDAILDRPAAGHFEAQALAAGDCVDRYRIVRPLGQGGMGSVYLVERIDGEFSQRAALKVIAPGHAHPVLVERFRRERQIMASLDHPGIARLIDGGHTDRGWPYLVMDYVEGEPIDRYCERQRLGMEARLQLVAQVCDAVDYAHRRLVVHRDLKPGNILVNAQGRPVLLDFGIAKLIDPEASDDATALSGLRPFTPGYAAPEQLVGGTIGVGVDVFALGVLIYELIGGRRPFAPEPSNPLQLSERIAEHKITSLRGHLGSALRTGRGRGAELDWIVRRALQSDPEKRYPGAADLGADLRALLAHRPVAARPDSLLYRSAKFCRRHWVGVSISIGFAATVVGFVVQLRNEAARTARALAASQIERDRHQAAADFLRSLFDAADSTQSGGAQISAVELLDRGRLGLESRGDLSDATRRSLQQTLAEVYRNLGRYQEARALLERAQAEIGDEQSADRLRLLADLGTVLQLGGDHEQAQALLQQALALADQLPASDEIRAEIQLRLGQAQQSLGNHQAAGRAFNEAHDLLIGQQSPDRSLLADAVLRLGSWHWMGGRLDQAEQWYRQALEMRRAGGDANLPELARALDAYGAVRHARGDFAEAVVHYSEAVALRRRVLGTHHSHTADSLSNLGAALYDQGDDAQAERVLTEALAIYEKVTGPDNPAVARTLNNLALVRQRGGDRTQALALYQRALSINRQAFGEQHRTVASNLNNLGLLSEQLGDLDAAQRYLTQAISVQEATLGADHVNLAFALGNLGRVKLWQGQPQAAVELLQRASELRQRGLPAEHPVQAETMSWLGYAVCVEQGEQARGAAMLEQALALREAGLEADAVATEESRALLGCCRLAAGDREGALAALQIAVPRLARHWPQSSPGWQMVNAALEQSIAP